MVVSARSIGRGQLIYVPSKVHKCSKAKHLERGYLLAMDTAVALLLRPVGDCPALESFEVEDSIPPLLSANLVTTTLDPRLKP